MESAPGTAFPSQPISTQSTLCGVHRGGRVGARRGKHLCNDGASSNNSGEGHLISTAQYLYPPDGGFDSVSNSTVCDAILAESTRS